MIDIAQSVNGVPIRLTEERWYHIIEHHDDVAGYVYLVLNVVEYPDFVVEGWQDELLAIKETEEKKFLVVVYREISKKDGFIITAYWTTKIENLLRRKIVWQKQT